VLAHAPLAGSSQDDGDEEQSIDVQAV